MWLDRFESAFGAHEIAFAEDRPFHFRADFAFAGQTGIGELTGTVVRMVRPASNKTDDFIFAMNASESAMQVRQTGHEALLSPGEASLVANFEWGETRRDPGARQIGVWIPRQRLLAAAPNAEDRLSHLIDAGDPAVRHLRRYVSFVLGFDAGLDDPLLQDHVETTLIDLVVLSLGIGGEAREIAHMRGLRAVRLRVVLGEVASQFADPAFSVERLARKLGFSVRYIQDLLHQSGASFTERVLELRLQKAAALLSDPRHDAVRISDIAFACGFNEASYFNRVFRRRFGEAPGGLRARRR
jgi:AraC-like DNA-binding protein